MKINVCAIFDVGKTNKKVFLFDEHYQIVWQKSVNFQEIIDEDGDACENIEALSDWVIELFQEIKNYPSFDVKAVNFSAYGASFVPVGRDGKPLTPLYNYLKPYPESIKKQFYDNYGGQEQFATVAASPVLGSLNSGMQIYRLKYEKPDIFNEVRYFLHLPQYLSFLLTGQFHTDITSVGCHTNLWDFTKMEYHQWVIDEKIIDKLLPIRAAQYAIDIKSGIQIGIGLHDSSSAIVPYLINFSEPQTDIPFVLISTGTWNISLNPFNDTPLTYDELQDDCLNFIHYQQKPVKAARLFAGNKHEIETKRLADHFDLPQQTYQNVAFDKSIMASLMLDKNTMSFENRPLSVFKSYEIAYHQLMLEIVLQQVVSAKLVIENDSVKKIFVDGGFSKNSIFMNLLSEAFPQTEVYAANIAQASALGAAVVIHSDWNNNPLPQNMISLKRY